MYVEAEAEAECSSRSRIQSKAGQTRPSKVQLPASNYLQQLLRSPPRLVTGKRLTKGRALQAGRAETMRALAACV